MATFPRAKLNRFNDVVGCAPPPGTYEPRIPDNPPLGHFDRSERFVVPKTPPPRVISQTPRSERRFSLQDDDSIIKESPWLRRSQSFRCSLPKRLLTIKKRDKACECAFVKPPPEMVSVKSTAKFPCPKCERYKRKWSRTKKMINGCRDRVELLTDMTNSQIDQRREVEMVVQGLYRDINSYDVKLKAVEEEKEDLKKKIKSLTIEAFDNRLQICAMADSMDELTAIRNELVIQKNQCIEDIKEKEAVISQSHADINSLKEELAIEKMKNHDLTTKVEELSEELQNNRESVLKMEEDMSALKLAVDQKKEQFQQLENNARHEKEVQDALLKRVGEERNRYVELTAILNELVIQKKQCIEDIKEKEAVISQSQADVSSLKEELAIEKTKNHDLTTKVEELSEELQNKRESVLKMEEDMCALKLAVDQNKEQFQQLENNARHEKEVQDALLKQVGEERNRYVELTAIHNELVIQKNQCIEDIKEKEAVISQSHADINSLKEKLAIEKTKNHDLTTKVEELSEELQNNRESVSKMEEDMSALKLAVDQKKEQFQQLENNARHEKEVQDAILKRVVEERNRYVEFLSTLHDLNDKRNIAVKDLHSRLEKASSEYNAMRKSHDDLIKSAAEYISDMLKDVQRAYEWMSCNEYEDITPDVSSTNMIPEDNPDGMIRKNLTDLHVAVGRVVKATLACQEQNSTLEKEIQMKNDEIRSMELLIGPYREQLEQLEQERQALADVTCKTKKELEEIALQQAASLGHQNHKQKIRYLVQLKESNLKLKDEVSDLQAQLRRKDRILWRLTKDSVYDLATPRGLAVSEKENSTVKK